MTQEEKAKAYDEALEGIEHYIKSLKNVNDGIWSARDIENSLSEIFPQLKESKEDKIRKALISGMDALKEQGRETFATININDCIAWLEKQGKSAQEVIKVEPKDDISIDPHFFKSTDNVESKFKAGDYVVDNCGYLWRIEGIINQFYILEGIDGGESRPTIEWVNNTFHLWTVQDAKDGDVLVSKFNQPFIYNGKYDEYNVGAYCGIVCDGSMFIETYNVCQWAGNEKIKPATKEQRDALMKAMADAGYSFDFEKKELKKIEQTPACSEEDEYNFAFIQEALLGLDGDDSYREKCCKMADWLESLKDKFVDFDKGFNVGFSAAKHNQWKPSEEQMAALSDINLTGNISYAGQGQELINLYNDLKKLRKE